MRRPSGVGIPVVSCLDGRPARVHPPGSDIGKLSTVMSGGLSRRTLRNVFADALESALGSCDLPLDSGFGPDTEQALIDIAFHRVRTDQSLITKARGTFLAEMASLPDSLPSYHEALRRVLTGMAHCSLVAWQAAGEDPPDIESADQHRDRRRTLLARMATLDADHFDSDDLDPIVGAVPITSLVSEHHPPETLESDALIAIFDHDIVPEIFAENDPRDEPSALLLCRSSARQRSALRLAVERDCAAVDPDLFAAYHPHAAVSVNAGVLHDTLLWTVMAIRYAVERSLDVVVQTAAEEPHQAAEAAALFAHSGYRVVVVGVDGEAVVLPVESGRGL
ncbi:zeta toxin family protein [Nocardia sp. NPDC049220]|uniref:zeta toxin family protein n=1 Tax=Nocardia sp. NPDC049220 TaxID=3155273 RepID=UPI003402158E